MSSQSEMVYERISSYAVLEEMIEDGEAEGLHVECKAPGAPKIGKDTKKSLAKALSGFSNTAGGVIIWGVSTTPHAHSGTDVLTQIEPIGQCRSFANMVDSIIPTLTTPAVLDSVSKVLRQKPKDSRGVVVTHVPKHVGNPVQSNEDSMFYFRSGDDFVVAPYEMIQRLFLATESPDLHPVFEGDLVQLSNDGFWEVPLIIQNLSNAVAENALAAVEIQNPGSCDEIQARRLTDQSAMNPGRRLFQGRAEGVIHRGLNMVLGALRFKMKVRKRARRVVRLRIELYANNMRARTFVLSVQLAKSGAAVRLGDAVYRY